MEYTKTQEKDILERVEKATKLLKELQLFPSAAIQKANLGEDIFADKILCYLADSKYTPLKSPIQPNDIKKTA